MHAVTPTSEGVAGATATPSAKPTTPTEDGQTFPKQNTAKQRAVDSTHAAIPVTFFDHRSAKTKTEKPLTLAALRDLALQTTAPVKNDLPWLKLATFGDVPTAKGSLRHNANMLELYGVEGDYDDRRISPKEAVQRLQDAGIEALVYTTPSHTQEQPKWRVLAPLAAPVTGTVAKLQEVRDHALGKVQTALGDAALSGESWTLSQSYFYGGVEGKTPVEAWLVEGRPVDLVDIPSAPRRKVGTTAKPEGRSMTGPFDFGGVDLRGLTNVILTGAAGVHDAGRDIAASLLGKGMRSGDVECILHALFDNAPDTPRMQKRRGEIPRWVESAVAKFGAQSSEQALEGLAKAREVMGVQPEAAPEVEAEGEVPWPEPETNYGTWDALLALYSEVTQEFILHQYKARGELPEAYDWARDQGEIQRRTVAALTALGDRGAEVLALYWQMRGEGAYPSVARDELKTKRPDVIAAAEALDSDGKQTAIEAFTSQLWAGAMTLEESKTEDVVDFTVEGLIPAGEVGAIGGGGGTGKTVLSIHLAIHIALGRPWMGQEVKQGKSVIITKDDGRKEVHAALKKVMAAMHLTDEQRLQVLQYVRVISVRGKPGANVIEQTEKGKSWKFSAFGVQVAADLREVKDLRLVVLDTLRQFSGADSTEESAMTMALQWLAQLTLMPSRPSACCLHHGTKEGVRQGVEDQYALIGSSAIADNARFVLMVRKVGQDSKEWLEYRQELEDGWKGNWAAIEKLPPEEQQAYAKAAGIGAPRDENELAMSLSFLTTILRVFPARGSLLVEQARPFYVNREGFGFRKVPDPAPVTPESRKLREIREQREEEKKNDEIVLGRLRKTGDWMPPSKATEASSQGRRLALQAALQRLVENGKVETRDSRKRGAGKQYRAASNLPPEDGS